MGFDPGPLVTSPGSLTGGGGACGVGFDGGALGELVCSGIRPTSPPTYLLSRLYPMNEERCQWPGDDPDEIAYHDRDWGVPTEDESTLFEALTLEGAQAGLSWHTILLRRDGYRRAFLDWDVEAIAEIDEAGVETLVQDEGIIRHRGKIESTIANANATLLLRRQGLSLADIVWGYADPSNEPRGEIQSQTDESRAMSRELKRRGFRFVGPTTCYAFMQAVGIVNDHTEACFRFTEIAEMRDRLLNERSDT